MRNFSYASIIRDSQRARWSIDEVGAGLHELDFSRPFLPERLAHTEPLHDVLGPSERLVLNHVRAHGYLRFFGLVERFILPFAMVHAADALRSSAERLLALMQFGEEEAKHIALFERFSEAFEFGFGSACEFIGPAPDITDQILAEEPLAVGLLVLHIEWMTQEHYTASVRGREDIEPKFASLLRHHWMEEAQHARIDTLLLEEMLGSYSDHARDRALRTYLRLLERFDALLQTQVELDLEALDRVGCRVPAAARERYRDVQLGSYRETFLRAGVEHRRVRTFINQHFGREQQRVAASTSRWQLHPVH